MPTYYDVFATTVIDGVATGDSTVVTIALYGSTETIDLADGAEIRVVDSNDNGLIEPAEWVAATGGGLPGDTGLGQNGGLDVALYDNDSNSLNGTLYSSVSYN